VNRRITFYLIFVLCVVVGKETTIGMTSRPAVKCG
jgi:hypothetical protein